jgi:hypothetical protein
MLYILKGRERLVMRSSSIFVFFSFSLLLLVIISFIRGSAVGVIGV